MHLVYVMCCSQRACAHASAALVDQKRLDMLRELEETQKRNTRNKEKIRECVCNGLATATTCDSSLTQTVSDIPSALL